MLYITDKVVGPHLELIRRVCEPRSASRPHVTVRFFDKLPVPAEYLETRVETIDLLEPGSFNADKSASGHTVYIRCRSDDLAPLEHKPHFPTSEFHITLYDGKSRSFAAALLRVLRRFRWGLRVSLPENTKLSQIPVRPKGASSPAKPREFKHELQALFDEIASAKLTPEYLMSLSSARRLRLVRQICMHLEASAQDSYMAGVEPRKLATAADGRRSRTPDPAVHLTPPELARAIATYVVDVLGADQIPVDFGDPAVGTGAFYAALMKALPTGFVRSAIGIDISPKQVDAARWRWSDKGMEVLLGDYLHMERLPPRSLIMANPPYLRHQGIPPAYKQALRERASVALGIKVSALSGQYVYFLLLSHAWMAPGAIAAWLIPAEFMQTRYGAAIRYYLTHKVQLLRVHRFDHDSPQFENAHVLPCVVVFRNIEPESHHLVELSAGGSLERPTSTEAIAVAQLRAESKWQIPHRPFVTHAQAALKLGDLFDIHRGIATGANGFFILDRSEARRMGLPKAVLRPVLPKARHLTSDVVDRDADGYPAVRPQLCLLDCTLSLREIRSRYPRLFKYLGTARSLGILDRTLVKRRHPWYKQERRGASPFLCTYMGRGSQDFPPLRFIWNKSDAVATNTYLMMYPKPQLALLLGQQPQLAPAVLAVLTDTARDSFASILRVHAGGLRKIEPGDLREVRLATIPTWLRALQIGRPQLELAYS